MQTRQEIGGRWKTAVESRASTNMERAIIVKGARARAGTDRFSLLAATSRKPLRGGLVPAFEWAGGEFGARSRQAEVRTRSRKGKAYTAKKWINRQFKGRVKEGRIAYDAASEIGTWAVAQWVQFIVDNYAKAGRKTN
ncbi:hypothetical protein [Microterricola gilva]|uniref:hypothetical protein n=1 Tax=Microterricola gilva TaxID=393267 RepID=UPI00102C20DC|nr:hypothetical protein [Microterricola gilva]